MEGLLHPVGRESASTYWLRRAVVVGAALVLVIGLVWLVWPKPDAVVAVPATTPSPTVTAPSTPATSVSPSVSASATPTGPVACEPTSIKVSVAGFRKVALGKSQTFSIGLANTGATACILDLSAATFRTLVTSGSDQIWTTQHCTKLIPTKKSTLKAGASYEFKVVWDLHRSKEGCGSVKGNLGTGTYVATGSYRESSTGRFVFVLNKK